MIWERDQLRNLVNMVMKFRIPEKCGHFLSRCAIISFRRQTVLHGVSKLVSHKDNVCVKIKFGFAPKKRDLQLKFYGIFHLLY